MITCSTMTKVNGDNVWSIYQDGRYIGQIRECCGPASCGDWAARAQRRGKMVSRYYGSRAGAIGWLRRQAKA